MRVSVGIAWVGIASAGACALFPDLSPLSGDTTDGAADVVGSDATTAKDAANDTGIDASIDAPSCGHAFCDDFDNETILFEKWDSRQITGGQIALSTDAVTVPNALAVTIGPGPVAGGPFVSKGFAKATKVHVEIDMKGSCTLPETDVVTLVVASPPAGYEEADLAFYQSPATAHLALGYILDGGVGVDDAGDLPLGGSFFAWRHYAIDVDFGSSTFSATTTGDAGTTTKTLPISPSIAPTAFTLNVGAIAHSQSSITCTVSFDDVVVDTQ